MLVTLKETSASVLLLLVESVALFIPVHASWSALGRPPLPM